MEAVRRGATTFVPKNWEKTYFDWMENIQPWCISRQLWWGHQIPAWYGFKRAEDDEAPAADQLEIFVAYSEDEAEQLAQHHYGCTVTMCETRQQAEMHVGQGSAAVWRE